MILFRCFPEIPVYDPQSDNAWVNRARYDTDEVLAQAVRGERPFTQYCCRVVEDLTHLNTTARKAASATQAAPIVSRCKSFPNSASLSVRRRPL